MLRYLKVRFEGTHMISWCYATWRYTWKLHISADPCLGQGRGRAWDHCRCGTGFCRFKPAVCLQSHLLLGRTSLPFVRPQTRKMPCGSFDQALWPQAFVVRAFKPAICLQSHLFLGRSSLPFASRQTRKMLRGATGIPRHSGKTPYKDPQSWSCRCSHVNFSLPRSGFSRKATLDILSFAVAWCSTCPVSAAQALARSLSRHLSWKSLSHWRALQAPRPNRLQLWPWSGARFCTRRIRNEGLRLALLFLSATFGIRLGCALVSARSSFQVRAWQSHARMHGSPPFCTSFCIILYTLQPNIPGALALDQFCHAMDSVRGLAPDQLLPVDGMGYFLRFALRQPFPRDISQKSSTWRWQLPRITCQNNV